MSSPAPKPHEYWQAPVPANDGDAEANSIFLAVGIALSAWEHIEASFSRMFGVLLEGESFAAERVFGTMVSNANKRTALTAASKVAFAARNVSEADTNTWELLLKHYEEGAIRRTEIAHGVLTAVSTDKPCGMFLMPPSYNTKKVALPWTAATKTGIDAFGYQYRYTSQDVNHFNERFWELVTWTELFHAAYLQNYPQKPLQKP